VLGLFEDNQFVDWKKTIHSQRITKEGLGVTRLDTSSSTVLEVWRRSRRLANDRRDAHSFLLSVKQTYAWKSALKKSDLSNQQFKEK